jgi:hypothetical protein
MRRLATGWGMPAAAAPWVKLACRLTATKAAQPAMRSMGSTYATTAWITLFVSLTA